MPSEAEAFAFGDIVLVPFPFTDQSASKRRPAVVVSGRRYNEAQPDVVLMPVTSQLRADARPGDVPVLDWRATGLLKPSAIKPLFATLEQSLVIRRLGALQEADREALRNALSQILG